MENRFAFEEENTYKQLLPHHNFSISHQEVHGWPLIVVKQSAHLLSAPSTETATIKVLFQFGQNKPQLEKAFY